MIKRYQAKLSGPLLDRIDIHIEVPRVDYDKLLNDEEAESSESVRERVEKAREQQTHRFRDYPHIYANGDMSAGEVQQMCKLTDEARQLLDLSVRKMQLSARAYHRILKLSRTIADLDNNDMIDITHIAEAIQYRGRNSEL